MFQFFAIYLYFMKTFIFFISPYHIKDTCLLRTHFFFLLHKKRRIYSYAFYDSLVLWNIAIFIKTLYREVLDTHTHTLANIILLHNDDQIEYSVSKKMIYIFIHIFPIVEFHLQTVSVEI